MTEPASTSGGRIRARPAGLLSPVTRLPIFRIEDAAGRVLRRIGSARDAGEAIAHYWRGAAADARLAAAMSDEPPADATLRRRIDRARAAQGRGPAARAAMLTHELPLSVPAPAPSAPGIDAPPRPPRGRRKAAARPAEEDLFASGDEGVAPDAEPPTAAEPTPATPEPEPEPEQRAAYHLDPQAVPLQPVDHRSLRPTDRSDSYLYHIGSRAEADGTLRHGLTVNAQDPIILTERQGVSYWLSVLAEDYDVILDGPADFVVLRVRRHAVEELLEADPDASQSAGCACYLLTGGAGSA